MRGHIASKDGSGIPLGRRRGTAFDSDDNDSDIGDVSLEPAPVCACGGATWALVRRDDQGRNLRTWEQPRIID
jgi:hypothetical protein